MKMIVSKNSAVLPGQVALKRGDKVIWVGRISAPWDDAACDEVVMSPKDYDELRMSTLPKGAKP